MSIAIMVFIFCLSVAGIIRITKKDFLDLGIHIITWIMLVKLTNELVFNTLSWSIAILCTVMWLFGVLGAEKEDITEAISIFVLASFATLIAMFLITSF